MNKMLQYAGIFQQQIVSGGGSPDPVVVNVTATELPQTQDNYIACPATVTAGNLLLMFVSFDGAPGIDVAPSGFTEIYNATSQAKGMLYAKVAAGTEGGTDVYIDTSANEYGSAHMYQISNWQGTIASGVISATPTVGAGGSTRTFPNLTSGWGSVPTLWIVSAHASSVLYVTSPPTNFTDLVSSVAQQHTGGGQTHSARRILTAASITPGTCALSGSNTGNWTTGTTAIRGTS